MKYVIVSSKKIFWHGTSSYFLRKILKKGLIVNKKEKVWDKSYKSLESLKGIYLSSNLKRIVAMTGSTIRKFKGNPLIVCVQIETRTPDIVYDEDYFYNFFDSYFYKYKNMNQFIDLYLNLYKYNVWEDFIKKISKELYILPININRYELNFNTVFKLYLKYKISLFYKTRYYEDFSKEDVKKIIDNHPPTVLKQFRKKLDILLKKMNFLSNNLTEDSSVRSTKDLTYRGKNKILVIGEIENKKVIIHYSINKRYSDMFKSNVSNLDFW